MEEATGQLSHTVSQNVVSSENKGLKCSSLPKSINFKLKRVETDTERQIFRALTELFGFGAKIAFRYSWLKRHFCVMSNSSEFCLFFFFCIIFLKVCTLKLFPLLL